MSKSYQATPQNPSDEFVPKSFIIFCLDQENNIAFEASWGESIDDVKKFAVLLSKVTSGDFNNMMLEQLKEQAKGIENGNKKFLALQKIVKDSQMPSELVIDPANVELN
jgi:hypothetical protein